MPKIGMEPIRRAALIDAAIAEIGRAGSLDVTVRQIAGRAGVSPALAHHYFGTKERIFVAAMGRILGDFGASVRAGLARAEGPGARLDAILDASFGPEQFEPEVVAAWLVFYVQAQTSPEAARLLRVYARRLDSNLRHELRSLVAPEDATPLARGLAAMIDGFYIRHALQDGPPDRDEALSILRGYLGRAMRRDAA